MSKNRTLTCNWFDKRFIRDLCSPHNTLRQREKPSKWYFAYVNNNDKIYGYHKKKKKKYSEIFNNKKCTHKNYKRCPFPFFFKMSKNITLYNMRMILQEIYLRSE